MAPSIAQEPIQEPEIQVKEAFDKKTHEGYKYANYLPVYDNTIVFPPTEPFEVIDRGSLADTAKPHLFSTKDPAISINKLTPRIGTEIKDLQLSQLTDAQKNELALLVAERGVVVFRGQDLKDIGPQKQKEFGPVGALVQDHIEFHNIYLGPDNLYRAQRSTWK